MTERLYFHFSLSCIGEGNGTNVSYFLWWICCFWGTMSFCSHFHVISLDFIFVEIWNYTCSKKTISEYIKLLRRKKNRQKSLPPEFSSVQFSCSVISDSLRPHELQQARPLCPTPTPGIYPNSCPLSQWFHPAISSSVVPFSSCPQIPPSIRVFSNESTVHMRWPKYWSFSFNISPFNEHSELISFRMDWLDLLAVQGTLKSLLQHHSSKTSILWRSAFFTVQLLHPYMTTGKTIALTRQTWQSNVSAFEYAI